MASSPWSARSTPEPTGRHRGGGRVRGQTPQPAGHRPRRAGDDLRRPRTRHRCPRAQRCPHHGNSAPRRAFRRSRQDRRRPSRDHTRGSPKPPVWCPSTPGTKERPARGTATVHRFRGAESPPSSPTPRRSGPRWPRRTGAAAPSARTGRGPDPAGQATGLRNPPCTASMRTPPGSKPSWPPPTWSPERSYRCFGN
jgi:hypothetical protein